MTDSVAHAVSYTNKRHVACKWRPNNVESRKREGQSHLIMVPAIKNLGSLFKKIPKPRRSYEVHTYVQRLQWAGVVECREDHRIPPPPPREQWKDVSQEESLWESLDVDGRMLFREIS